MYASIIMRFGIFSPVSSMFGKVNRHIRQ